MKNNPADATVEIVDFDAELHGAEVADWVGETAIRFDLLPNGFVAKLDGVLVGALFVYLHENAATAMVDHAIWCPGHPPAVLNALYTALMEHAEEFALANGKIALRAFTGRLSVANTLQDLGFKVDGTSITSLFKPLTV